jgi:hypothetical protein
MTDSTKAGILDSEDSDILSAEFDNKFQAWLSDALEITPYAVRPVFKTDVTKSADYCDEAYYQFGNYTQSGSNALQVDSTKGGENHVEYFGTVSCTVTIYSERAREKAFRLCDLGTYSQNTHDLDALGLGWISASVRAVFAETVGARLRLRADVQIDFNYRYSRAWAVRRLVNAEPLLIFNQ